MGDLAAFLHAKRAMILDAVGRAEQLAHAMASRSMDLVVCHADIYPGNLLIDTMGTLFIVDWVVPILAPKERDLMFIGGGRRFMPYSAEHEEMLFYRGYRHVPLDAIVLAYYRYERGITDITVECERVLSRTLGKQDRAQALDIVQLYFLPGCTLEMAYKVDQTRELSAYINGSLSYTRLRPATARPTTRGYVVKLC
jgi:spectinomycin phosphotransferase